MRLTAIFVLFLLFRGPAFGIEKDFIFERISPEEGFAFSAVNTIMEDENGFVWFGCNNGLFYYNSFEISRYNFDPQRKDSPPSNKINKLYKDNQGRLWVCTDNGVCYFNNATNSFTRIDLKQVDSYLKSKSVTFLLQYTDNEYLIVINNSLFSFNTNDLTIRPIVIGSETKKSITYLERGEDNKIYIGTSLGEVYATSASALNFKIFYRTNSSAVRTICLIDKYFWIGFQNDGVDLVDSEGRLIDKFRQESLGERHLPNDRVRKIIKRKNGDIWIATYNGIFVVDKTGNHTITQNTLNKLPHNSIYDLCLDQNDGVWAGTWSGGLAYYNDYNYRFRHIQRLTDWIPGTKSVISCFAETPDGKIWIGSESKGLSNFNLKDNSFDSNSRSINGESTMRIKSLMTDKTGKLWIGTFYEGLWYLDKKTNILHQSHVKIKNVMNNISSITPAKDGLWVGTREEGLIFYNPDNESYKLYNYEEIKIKSISSDKIWMTYLDSKGNLWVCTDFGLSVKQKDSEDFERFFQNENSGSLSRNIIYSICEDRNGNMWIGTNGGGIDIYNPADKTIRKLALNNILDNADIYSIIKDHHNNMWFSTNVGIHVYSLKTGKLKSFTEQDGLAGSLYNPNSAFINSTGQLLFGGSNGFNIINPDAVKENPIIPQIFVSKLFVNNRSILDQPIRYVNSYHLANLEKIELEYNQNSLIFNFVSNSFIKSLKNKFRYRLVNYQNEWFETSSGKDVSFTKIPSGQYILEVFGSNNDGVWSKIPKRINIKIYPPIWITWYAYIFYLISISTILFFVIREVIYHERSRKEFMAERYKREADEILFSEKTNFFTNVSHEFRTPLTLIISPLNNLMKKFKDDQYSLGHLSTMKRNADRLLRLTNQILDFRLLELGKIKITPAKNEIVSLCKEICECFEYQIVEKEINFVFLSSFKSLELSFDADMIEKVVYNILSNAFKFSPEKGQIILSVEHKILDENSYSGYYCTGNQFTGDSLEIKVRDYGKGIETNHVSKIFDRFFILHQNQETGTGIGLHICQEYISLHSGNILVASQIENGTTFIINLPLTSSFDSEKENIIFQPHYDKLNDPVLGDQADFNPAFFGKMILIVEDNDELRIYLKNFLLTGYKVLSAKNGKQAIEIALEVIPDLIISDILMPGMDGLELTSQIRNNPKTNHIPVILLTALSGNSVQIDSMNRGADLFLTKPIDESLLLAQIDNILTNRENLVKKIGENMVGASPAGDKKLKLSLIQQAENYILENIRNEHLDIYMLADELNISRSSLYRKLMAHTNQSATEFIRDVRLKYALKLIKERIYNIDEIASLSGFNSTSYFNRTFKQKYGKTPKENQKG